MDKWQTWAEDQRALGNTLTLDNGNEFCAAVRVQQHEGPDFYMTVPASAVPAIFPEANHAC